MISDPRGPDTTPEDSDQRVWPLLIAGGPALSMNPEPLAPFFDAIVIGEAEELLPRLTDLLVDGIGGDRERLLDALAALPGIYVPSRRSPSPGWQPATGSNGCGCATRRRWSRSPVSTRPTPSSPTAT